MRLLLLALLLAGTASAQQASYEIISTDPDDISKKWVAVEPIYTDVGFDNTEGGQVGAGATVGWAWGRLGASGAARVATYPFIGSFGFQAEAGGHLVFSRKDRPGTLKLPVDGYVSGTYTTTTRSLSVSGTHRRDLHLRGGVYLRNGGYADDVLDTGLTNTGLYVGIARENTSFGSVRLAIEGEGGEQVVAGGYRILWYFDLLLLSPSLGEDLPPGVDPAESGGLRFGADIQGRPVPTSTLRSARRNLSNMIRGVHYRAEYGVRPYDGSYVMVSIGIPIIRR